ncbi:galactose-specific lectin nattectin-like [Ostrea edulis]|uniref:galactose-specific lectin nattectin-like n=1 Tax=Ostrea edulis TaxID=37623 RepID=UPI0024AF4C72|nr:galactose-specific lectin nattectin-like [Ostrea edulis]
MKTPILRFVFLVFTTQLEIGLYKALGIKEDSGQCGTIDSILNVKSQMNTQLIELEKRLKEEFSHTIKTLQTGIKRSKECPKGWERHKQSCYGINTQALTWHAADTFCRNLFAHLAEIDTKKENDFIRNMLKNYADLNCIDRAWVGGTDIHKDKTWTWSFSGSPLRFKNWNKGEPKDKRGEECMAILFKENNWDDIKCSYLSISVCEKEI